MHVNIKYKTTQILQSRSMPRQPFLQAGEACQSKKGHLESGRPGGWVPSPRTLHFCHEIKKQQKAPQLGILETWRGVSTTIDPGRSLALRSTTLNSVSFAPASLLRGEEGKPGGAPPDH